MSDNFDFKARYANGEVPWDSGKVSAELLRVLDSGALKGKTALEIGCGTGLNAVELARRGFQVTAVDLVEQPVAEASERAKKAKVSVDFRVADVLKDDLGGPYDVLFERGVYHILRRIDLKGFQNVLKTVTRPGSLWFSLAGNSKEDLEEGLPVVSEAEIRSEWAPLFEILELHEFRFDSRNPEFKPLGWAVLGRRR